ncbi:MAG TPA: sulfatase-like hydrolase/transferase, partial [Allosphingosinicella sp.]|nr:sulfatase-like hydrolase/transferase [Allosphingosinicella sp.]
AYSHVGFTTESLKSLFSGQLEPRAGGPSLFRDLKANGYRIGIFSGQPESFGDISEVVGMQASADVFRDAESLKAERAFGFAAKGSLLVDGKILLREFDRTFGRAEAWSRPVFLYFNLQSAHFPYHHTGMEQLLPGRPIPRDKIGIDTRDWVAATYWNAVAQADGQIGALVARLKALGVYDDSIILVTADHGESLFDDGFLGHGHMLNRQQTHIPLVINVPGIADSAPRGLQDFRPLLLRLLGAKQVREPARGDRPVLEYIGTLDRPAFVGVVDAAGRWTVMKVQDRSVRFSDVPGAFEYDKLAGHPDLKKRVEMLVRSWAMARWEKHLSQRRR